MGWDTKRSPVRVISPGPRELERLQREGGREGGRQLSPKNLQPQEVSVSGSKSPPTGTGTAASHPPSKASTLKTEPPAGWNR